MNLDSAVISIKLMIDKVSSSRVVAEADNIVNNVKKKADKVGESSFGMGKANNNFNREVSKTAQTGNKLVGILKGIGSAMILAFGIDRITHSIDEYNEAIGHLMLGSENARGTLDEIYKRSQHSGTDFTEQGNIVGMILQNKKHLGIDQGTAIDVSETLGKALAMSGGGMAQQKAALIQFQQMLGSEKVSNLDLKPLLHDAPALGKALQDVTGKTTTALMGMASQGMLAPKQVLEWIKQASEQVDKDFKKFPKGFAQSRVVMGNAITYLLGKANDGLGLSNKVFSATQKIANLLMSIPNHLREIVAIGGTIGILSLTETVRGNIINSLTRRRISLQRLLNSAISRGGILSAKNLLRTGKLVALAYTLSLVWDDITVWMQGGDSIMGRMFGKFADIKEKAKGLVGDMYNFFKGLGLVDGRASGVGEKLQSLVSFTTKWGGALLIAITVGNLIYKTFIFIKGVITLLQSSTIIWNGILVITNGLMSVLSTLSTVVGISIGWIGVILVSVIALVVLIVVYWKDIKKVILEVWDAVSKWVANMWGKFMVFFNSIKAFWVSIWTEILDWCSKKINALLSPLKKLGQWLGLIKSDAGKISLSPQARASSHGVGMSKSILNQTQNNQKYSKSITTNNFGLSPALGFGKTEY